jgi:hypothetical protein
MVPAERVQINEKTFKPAGLGRKRLKVSDKTPGAAIVDEAAD